MIEGLGCVGTASMYLQVGPIYTPSGASCHPAHILPTSTHPLLPRPTPLKHHTHPHKHALPTPTPTPTPLPTLSHPSLALTSPPLTGGKQGYWHSVPSRIAVNMIICCASGGTLAVLVASWMQVGPALALGPDYTTSTVLQWHQ